jgi:hypothetical protein
MMELNNMLEIHVEVPRAMSLPKLKYIPPISLEQELLSDPASLEELQAMLGFNIGDSYEYDTTDYEK